MVFEYEASLLGYLFLKLFYPLLYHLFKGAAFLTDQVVMMFMEIGRAHV